MMKKVLAVVLLMFFFAPLALAAGEVFTKADKNKDGRISEQEYVDQASEIFERLDKNHDGTLKPDELQSLDKGQRDKLLKAADTNKDGVIFKEEYEKAVRSRFSTMDKNRDGYIDKKEFISSLKDRNTQGFVLFTF